MTARTLSDPAEVVGLANESNGTRWTLVRKMAGGYQQGAYELADGAGHKAVLKWHTRHLPAAQLRATTVALDGARRRGWPTARWFAYGPLGEDGAYIVEELIGGERPTGLEDSVLQRLIDAVRLQAGVHPVTAQDWSGYIRRVVFQGEAGLAARLRVRPETAALLSRLEALVAHARDVPLPSSDLVHGDFVLGNMVVREGQPYLVDAAHAGKGTRVYDLATLLMETTVGADFVSPSTADQRRLERECLAIAGRDVFLICIASRIMHLIAFGEVHWSEQVAQVVSASHAFLDSLDSVRDL